MSFILQIDYLCAAQPRQPSCHSPEQINNGQLDTEYRLRMLERSYDCIIKEGGASYTRTRNLWIVHSHYRGTVKASMLT